MVYLGLAGKVTRAQKMLSKEFVLAGRSVFTVSNPSGERYTFRVNKSKESGNRAACWFVSLLTGPDNTSDFTYLGLLRHDTGAVLLTRASRYKADSKPVRVAEWVLANIWLGLDLPEGYAVHHEGRCGKCGRVLTVPESIESGIGPECAKQLAFA